MWLEPILGDSVVAEAIHLLEVFEKAEEWFNRHLDELRKKYEGMFVAVKGETVVAVDESLEKLLRRLEEMGEDPSSVYIASLPARDVAFIL